MAKNQKPVKPATENVEGFEVKSAAASEQQPPAPVAQTDAGQADAAQAEAKPETTADAVAQQLGDKTAEDVELARARLATAVSDSRSPLDLALEQIEAELKKRDDVKKAFDFLRELEAIPAKTKLEAQIKAACIARARKHTFDIQQMPSVPHIGANELATLPGLKTAGIQAERVELRARNDRDIQSLLAENEALRAQLVEKNQNP